MQSTLPFNLANSLWFMEHRSEDVLSDHKWINAHLNMNEDQVPNQVSQAFTETLKHLRTIVLDVFTGKSIGQDLSFLNTHLEKSTFYHQISVMDGAPSIQAISTCPVEDKIVADIILELLQLVETSAIEKIRRCENEDCRFYYLDKSKNQSKKYCSSKCNNIAKVRRYRKRHEV